jgi:hypothetical protein
MEATCSFGSMKYTTPSVDMAASVIHLLHWKADALKNFNGKIINFYHRDL